MTGTGVFDFAVLGSPTVLRHTDRVTFSQPSDSSSWAGSKDSQVRPRSSPKRSPVKAAVATAVADGSVRTLSIARISSSEYGLVSAPFGCCAWSSQVSKDDEGIPYATYFRFQSNPKDNVREVRTPGLDTSWGFMASQKLGPNQLGNRFDPELA